jgi:hypothetical protein
MTIKHCPNTLPLAKKMRAVTPTKEAIRERMPREVSPKKKDTATMRAETPQSPHSKGVRVAKGLPKDFFSMKAPFVFVQVKSAFVALLLRISARMP